MKNLFLYCSLALGFAVSACESGEPAVVGPEQASGDLHPLVAQLIDELGPGARPLAPDVWQVMHEHGPEYLVFSENGRKWLADQLLEQRTVIAEQLHRDSDPALSDHITFYDQLVEQLTMPPSQTTSKTAVLEDGVYGQTISAACYNASWSLQAFAYPLDLGAEAYSSVTFNGSCSATAFVSTYAQAAGSGAQCWQSGSGTQVSISCGSSRYGSYDCFADAYAELNVEGVPQITRYSQNFDCGVFDPCPGGRPRDCGPEDVR